MATGRKTVVVGQVIDPVTWGNPLWDQSVQTFASAADRTTQFAAPKQGAVTWLEDTKSLEFFDGTSWRSLLSPPSANCYLPADLSVPANTVTIVGKTPGPWTAGLAGGITLDNATGAFTVPIAGLYQLTIGARWDNNTSGPDRLAWVANQGGTRVVDYNTYGSVPVTKVTGGTKTVRLAAGDKLTMNVFHNAAGALLCQGNANPGSATWLDLRWVGA